MFIYFFRESLSEKLELRVLLPAVEACYLKLLELKKYRSITYLMSLLGDSFTGKYYGKNLQKFLINCLEFRHNFDDLDAINIIEPAVISCIVCMVLKMNEKEFNVFFKLINGWVAIDNKKFDSFRSRSISFYKYVCKTFIMKNWYNILEFRKK